MPGRDRHLCLRPEKNRSGASSAAVSDLRTALGRELLVGLKRDLVSRLDPDERAVVEAATGEMGNKLDAVRLGWLRMRTKEPWTKQRYAVTVRRALTKLREMVEAESATKDGEGSAE